MNVLISAVIPTRNRPQLVVRAVRSVLNQTYKNMEAVVVIDGTDALTVDALGTLHDPRVRIIVLVENVGGSEARNVGVKEAKGEFVSLLDDDDEWLPEKIEKQFAVLIERGNADSIIVCDYFKRRMDNDECLVRVRAPRDQENIGEYMFGSDNLWWPPYRNLPVTNCYFANRNVFIATPFRKGLAFHQDWDWLLRVMSWPGRKMIVVEEPLVIVYWELSRQHVSVDSSWKLSLKWVDSSVLLLTPKAYSGFVVSVTMRLVSEVKGRISAFSFLLTKCKDGGCLTWRQVLIALKWFILFPHLQQAIKKNILNIKTTLSRKSGGL